MQSYLMNVQIPFCIQHRISKSYNESVIVWNGWSNDSNKPAVHNRTNNLGHNGKQSFQVLY